MAHVGQSPSVDQVLQQVDGFFMKTGPVHETLRDLARRLSDEGIEYALIGGMALALHGFVRPTQDVDLLMTREGLGHFRERLVGRGYVPIFEGARKHFRDAATGVNVEVITTGEYPGDGKPKAVAFPDPVEASIHLGEFSVARLETLIELKLASGLSAEHRMLRDLADVQQLIEKLNLPMQLGESLDSSVRDEYARLWRLVQKGRSQETSPDKE